MMKSLRPLLPAMLGVYLASSAVIWVPVLPIILVFIALGVLLKYSIPPVSQESADAVLTPGRCQVIAHKCAANDAPENTISGIREAKKNGADAIEFDVGYTSDGVAVLMHDDLVDRTTDGCGQLNRMPWSHVQNLKAAVKGQFSNVYPNEKVPSLEEAVQTCLQLGLKIYFDVKGNPSQSAAMLPALFEKYPDLYKMGIVCSFYPNVIYQLRKVDPKIVTGLTWRPRFLTHKGIFEEPYDQPMYKRPIAYVLDYLLGWAHFTVLWKLCGNSAFLIIKDSCDNFMVRKFKELGIHVVVWTVNDDVEKKYFSEVLGCSVITDCVKKSVPSGNN